MKSENKHPEYQNVYVVDVTFRGVVYAKSEHDAEYSHPMLTRDEEPDVDVSPLTHPSMLPSGWDDDSEIYLYSHDDSDDIESLPRLTLRSLRSLRLEKQEVALQHMVDQRLPLPNQIPLFAPPEEVSDETASEADGN